MKCPACQNEMKEVTVEDVTVDVCDGGCGGIWFDHRELKKLDEPHETGQSLLDIPRDVNVTVDHEVRVDCPKCLKIMMRHFFSVKNEVEVDECGHCGGYWLDCGELRKIRELYQTEDERKQAARDYFDDVFGEDLKKMREESVEKLKSAQSVANVFKFVCPTYYIPGDQDWGAF